MDDTNISALLFEHDYTNITGYVNNYIDYPVYIDINDFIWRSFNNLAILYITYGTLTMRVRNLFVIR